MRRRDKWDIQVQPDNKSVGQKPHRVKMQDRQIVKGNGRYRDRNSISVCKPRRVSKRGKTISSRLYRALNSQRIKLP